MSFGELASARTPPSLPGKPPPATPGSLANELRGHLRALAANSAALRACGADDARRARALRSQNRELARDATALAGRLDASAGGGGAVTRAEADELAGALKARVADYYAALRESAPAPVQPVPVSAATVAALPGLGASRQSPATGGIGVSDETAPLLQSDAAAALRRELAGSSALRAQRTDALRDIQADVVDVQGIMRDLAGLVGEQGTTITLVADNVADSAEATNAAASQLSRARAARASRRKFFFLLLALAVGIFFVLTLILLS